MEKPIAVGELRLSRGQLDEIARLVLHSAEGFLAFAGSIGDRPLVERMAMLHQLLDAGISVVLGAFREARGVVPDCRQGCSWCCNMSVVVPAFEAVYIAAWLEQEGRATTALAKRLKANSRQRWAGKHPWCVFLAHHECSIYPVRPGVCRAFYSADAQLCRRSSLLGYNGDILVPSLAGTVALGMGLANALVAAGRPHGLGCGYLFEDALLAVSAAGGARAMWEKITDSRAVFGREWPPVSAEQIFGLGRPLYTPARASEGLQCSVPTSATGS